MSVNLLCLRSDALRHTRALSYINKIADVTDEVNLVQAWPKDKCD